MRLTLRNFQSHSNTVLDFEGDFVCIVGPNNIGKSAVIRAVRWILWDSLRGSRFIKKGTKEASAELTVNGHVVERIKGPKKNAYKIDGRQLDAINKGAPPEVVDALDASPVYVDKDTSLQLQVVLQTENPFLLDGTGTARAKILNALTGHHVLDIAIRSTTAGVKKLNSEQKHLGERTAQLNADLEAYADLAKQEADVTNARELHTQVEQKIERTRLGRDLKSNLEKAREAISSIVTISADQLPKVGELWSLVEEKKLKAVSVGALRSEHLAATKLRTEAVRVSTVNAAQINTVWERLETLKAQKAELLELQDANLAVTNVRYALGQSETALQRTVSQLSMLTGTDCPTCGQELTEKCLAGAA